MQTESTEPESVRGCLDALQKAMKGKTINTFLFQVFASLLS